MIDPSTMMVVWIIFAVLNLAILVGIVVVWFRYLKPMCHQIHNSVVSEGFLDVGDNSRSQDLAVKDREIRMLLDDLPGLVARFDTDCRYLWANREYRRVMGFTFDQEIKGISLRQVLGEEDWAQVAPYLKRVLKGERVTFVRRRDLMGEPRDIQAMCVPEYINGRVKRFIVLVVDINDRLSVEIALQESLERFRIAVNSITDAVITTDTDDKIVTMNPVAEEMTGLQSSEQIGRPLSDVLQILIEKEGELAEFSLKEVKESSDQVQNLYLVSSDGGRVPIALSAASLQSDSKEKIGTLLAFRNLTHERQLQRQLQFSEKMRAVGVLAGGIAHDFNNMLSVISGVVSLIPLEEKGNLSTATVKHLATIQRSVDRAAELTERLMAFTGKGRLSISSFKLDVIVQEVLEILEQTIDRKIEFSVENELNNGIVYGDYSAIQSAIMNICINAVQSMKDYGTVSIKMQTVDVGDANVMKSNFQIEPGSFHKVSISDTGVGISPSEIDKIFDPFFTTKGTDGGLGLGLSAVYRTAVDHHGSIEVDSVLGLGTTFLLMLPRSEQTMIYNGNKTIKPSTLTTRSGDILLVDDEADVLEVGKKMLEFLGFNVLTACDGSEALRIFEKKNDNIGYLFTDMNMPVMNGTELIARAAKLNPSCRFVIITGFSEEQALTEASSLGVDKIIRKPFQIGRLEEIFASFDA